MDSVDNSSPETLRLLTYNIQTGIASPGLHNYVTSSWQYLLPTQKRFTNLDNIARLLRNHDIVALQEVDAGSVRTRYVNQVEYLAHQAKFPYWYSQLNRNLGRWAQHSNGFLSRLDVLDVEYHPLPGRVGRGAMVAKLVHGKNAITIINVHLALGGNTRRLQLAYIADLIATHPNVVVLGDMNCAAHHADINEVFSPLGLYCASAGIKTYPSWHPWRTLDQMWVSKSIQVKHTQAKQFLYSDHLPLSAEIYVS